MPRQPRLPSLCTTSFEILKIDGQCRAVERNSFWTKICWNWLLRRQGVEKNRMYLFKWFKRRIGYRGDGMLENPPPGLYLIACISMQKKSLENRPSMGHPTRPSVLFLLLETRRFQLSPRQSLSLTGCTGTRKGNAPVCRKVLLGVSSVQALIVINKSTRDCRRPLLWNVGSLTHHHPTPRHNGGVAGRAWIDCLL